MDGVSSPSTTGARGFAREFSKLIARFGKAAYTFLSEA
jgi:hypothetical protein